MPAHGQQLSGYGIPLPSGKGSLPTNRQGRVLIALQQTRRAMPGPRQQPPLPPTPQDQTQKIPTIKRTAPRVQELETANPRQILDLIGAYAKGRRTVTITYRKATTGETVTREVEPYSLRYKTSTKRGRVRFFYGFCLPHGGIHSFLVDNIISVKGTSRRFMPRWLVEF